MPLDMTGGGGGGRERSPSLNVLGGTLETCSIRPMTGFFRNGCCDTGPGDFGSHTVCVVLTAEFLQFSRLAGNDLSTPIPSAEALQACSRAIAGACARRAGRRRWRMTPRRAWCCAPPISRRWNIARWKT